MQTAAHRHQRAQAMLVGALGAGFALATGELASAALDASPSPVLAVGGRFIDRFSGSLKELAVAVFGTNDKPALVVGTVVITLALGAVSGRAALRRPWAPWAVFGAFGALGAWAQATDRRVGALEAVAVAIAAVLAGAGATSWLLAVGRARPTTTVGPAGPDPDPAPGPGPGPGPDPDAVLDAAADAPPALAWSRRRFVLASGALIAVGTGFVTAGRALARGDIAAAAVFPLPRPIRRRTVPEPADLADAVDAGVSSYLTPNAEFYRIDTALSSPRVDPAGWRLRVHGMVDTPFTIGYEELLSMDSVEEVVTLQCVSNEVGDGLVGNAVWQGVPLRALLERAGVHPSAEQVFSTSVDGWTCGFPLAALADDRPVLVAYAMNGERLPIDHGFPARLVVAGLYGYVSATKWLSEIELTTWDGADGYWVPRGWSKTGPIKLASRIDVPAAGATIGPGPTVLGGVAWLPSVGVSRVEVAIDDGAWAECRLAPVASEHTWVQWTHR
ncbi:MAG: molybdopterin-dependent oxidoreductase, partial [Acidimicrobiales bacterium]|nr:molybdopterin-dependent oxidoreductase [Acidimicrobiales bacterium]